MKLLDLTHADAKKLVGVRAQHVSKKKEINALGNALLPIEEAREKLRVDLKRAIERSDEKLWKYRSPPPEIRDRYSAGFHPALPRELSWSFLAIAVGGEDVLLGRLGDSLVINGKPGMPTPEREAKLQKARQELEDIEIQEEKEICRLESAGWTVLRRGDADPKLLRRIWAGEDAPRKATPPNPSKLQHINDGAALNANIKTD